MDPDSLQTLLHQSESDTLDFKQDQYRFRNATDDEKSELLKDILAFANAWKNADAHIVIGVIEKNGRAGSVCGLAEHLDDHSVQQFINFKTNRAINFSIESIHHDGKELDVITIRKDQTRPLFAVDKYGRVQKNVVYVRRGSSTAIAPIDEIAAMGKAGTAAESQPTIEVEFADTTTHARSGSQFTVVSTQLLKADNDESLYEAARILPEELGPGNPWMGTADTQPPSRPEWEEYFRMSEFYRPLGFRLFNSGRVNAANVLVEVRVPVANDPVVVNAHTGPRKPQSRADQVRSPWGFPTLSLLERSDHHLITISCRVLQPKAEYWSEGIIYVAGLTSATVQCSVRVFADNLPNPLTSVLRLTIKSKKREYTRAELRKFIEHEKSP